ncbi:MAG TPA: ABC transporter permease [Bacteroidales bacterium]|nr:ABC transporter permease [Bacteroidales bacterium]
MDLTGNKVKTALIMLTLFVGAMSAGIVVMFCSFFVSEANKAYQNAQPHDIVIKTGGFSQEILGEIRNLPEVGSAENRRRLTARMVTGDKKINTNLIVLGDTNTIDVLRKSDGSVDLPGLEENELYLERAALEEVDKKPGDTLEVILEGNRVYELKIRELVYDAVTEPYTLEGDIVAFINQDTLGLLTGQKGFNEILLRVTGGNSSRERNMLVAKRAADLLESRGIAVNETEVPQPGTFYATQAMEAITIIMTLIGSLSVLLGVSLIVNIINSMMLQHIRQIGIMKAVGGQLLFHLPAVKYHGIRFRRHKPYFFGATGFSFNHVTGVKAPCFYCFKALCRSGYLFYPACFFIIAECQNSIRHETAGVFDGL